VTSLQFHLSCLSVCLPVSLPLLLLHLCPLPLFFIHYDPTHPQGNFHICLQCVWLPKRQSAVCALTNRSRAEPKRHTEEHLVPLYVSNLSYHIKSSQPVQRHACNHFLCDLFTLSLLRSVRLRHCPGVCQTCGPLIHCCCSQTVCLFAYFYLIWELTWSFHRPRTNEI